MFKGLSLLDAWVVVLIGLLQFWGQDMWDFRRLWGLGPCRVRLHSVWVSGFRLLGFVGSVFGL